MTAMRRNLGILFAAGALCASGPAVPALGAEDGIPRTSLAVAGKTLRGGAWSTQESHPAGPNMCVTGFGDGIPTVSRHVEVDAGRHEATVLFRRTDRPLRVDVTVYRRLDRYDTPTGRWREPDLTLEPVARDGRTIGWAASFSLRVRGRRYVDAFAKWPDEDGCGEDEASYIYPGIRPG
jgi:hypothetical protein